MLRAESPWAPTAVALHGNAVYVSITCTPLATIDDSGCPRVRKVDASGQVRHDRGRESSDAMSRLLRVATHPQSLVHQ